MPWKDSFQNIRLRLPLLVRSWVRWLSDTFRTLWSRMCEKVATFRPGLPTFLLTPFLWVWNLPGRLFRWVRGSKPTKETLVGDDAPETPLAQPVALLGIPNPFNIGLYLKAAVLVIAVGFGAYRIGLWQGEGVGYVKRDRELAAERARINTELDVLNAALDEALAKLDAGRDQASADVAKTVKDIPPAVRAQCAKECSLPKSTRSALESIQ